MGYCSKEELLARIPQEYLIDLTDDDGDGIEDNDVISEVIEQASSEIDAYLSRRYDTPLLNVPAVIEKICVELVIYYLHLRADKVTDAWKDTYERAIELLRSLANGDVKIGNEQQSSIIKSLSKSKTFNIEEML